MKNKIKKRKAAVQPESNNRYSSCLRELEQLNTRKMQIRVHRKTNDSSLS